jgi:putative transcriptional regulator
MRTLSDEAIGVAVGERIKKLRLLANFSQEEVVKSSGISRQTLINLESHGKGTLLTLIAVLRAIDCLERLSSLLEDVRPSPIKVVSMGGKIRLRASRPQIDTLVALKKQKPKAVVEW